MIVTVQLTMCLEKMVNWTVNTARFSQQLWVETENRNQTVKHGFPILITVTVIKPWNKIINRQVDRLDGFLVFFYTPNI